MPVPPTAAVHLFDIQIELLNMKKYILTLLSILAVFAASAQGNHVFSGLEVDNFGSADLVTPGGQTWSTEQAAAPGYFCAYYPGCVFTCAATGAAGGTGTGVIIVIYEYKLILL